MGYIVFFYLEMILDENQVSKMDDILKLGSKIYIKSEQKVILGGS